MRVTEKGTVTIPGALRRKAGLLPGTEVEFTQQKKGVLLTPAKPGRRPTQREQKITDTLERLRGSATIGMTTEEIMALTRDE